MFNLYFCPKVRCWYQVNWSMLVHLSSLLWKSIKQRCDTLHVLSIVILAFFILPYSTLSDSSTFKNANLFIIFFVHNFSQSYFKTCVFDQKRCTFYTNLVFPWNTIFKYIFFIKILVFHVWFIGHLNISARSLICRLISLSTRIHQTFSCFYYMWYQKNVLNFCNTHR